MNFVINEIELLKFQGSH